MSPRRGVEALQRAPSMRVRRYKPLPALYEVGTWPAAVEACKQELRACFDARKRGVLNLLVVLLEECRDRRTAVVELTRGVIADRMHLSDEYGPENVRRLANIAVELGELVVLQGVGYRANGQRGSTSNAWIPVRLLPYLSALPAPRRRVVLADERVGNAIRAREAAITAALDAAGLPEAGPATNAAPAASEAVAGAVPVVSTSPANERGKPLSLASESRKDPATGNASEITARAREAAAAPQGEVSPAATGSEPAGPSTGPSAWGGEPTAASVAEHGEAREAGLQLARHRAALEKLRALLRELEGERDELAAGLRGPRRLEARDAEAASSAEVAELRDRDRQIRGLRLTLEGGKRAAVTLARFAASERRTARRDDASGIDALGLEQNERLRAAADEHQALLGEAPAAWRALWLELVARGAVRERLGALAERLVGVVGADAGELVLIARDGFAAAFIADVWGDELEELARELGLELEALRVEVRR